MSPEPTKDDDSPAAQLTMQLTSSKKKKKRRVATASGFAAARPGETTRAEDASRHGGDDDGPLVIPAQQDTFKKATQQQVKVEEEEPAAASAPAQQEQEDDQETADAVRALEEQATGGGSKATAAGAGNRRIIPSNSSTSGQNNERQQETQQYHKDLAALPEELSETADAYQTVPIAEFGAALLRGMGWKGGDDDDGVDNASKKDDSVMPRPHRLGLGAIPAAAPPEVEEASSRRPQRPDQFDRQKVLREQQDQYARERAAQVAADRQRTLQNGSLVWLVRPSAASSSPTTGTTATRRRRARVVQLVGVPGLARVAVVVEGGRGDNNSTPTTSTPEVVQRNEIERLLTRQELEDEPFREGLPRSSEKPDKSDADEERKVKKKQRTSPTRDDDNGSSTNNKSQSRKKDDRKKRRRDEGDNVKSSSSKRANSNRAVWLIPNIRVRVISEKLGRRHYKAKGVVVDVTPAGATLEMSSSSSQAVVLDHVPERYLETALPKVGGRVVALAGPHKWTKGRLLERDARKGVIQAVDHDMNVHTLPLDDLAEWCGPLDDE